jgi:UDP-hydrolysing UDP-N-acetyl-D-glucosamine 2-epimerase
LEGYDVISVMVVTVGRSDYSILKPVMRALESDPAFNLLVTVAGMHLSPEFGATSHHIEADGFQIDERIEMTMSSDSAEGTAKSMGLGILGYSQVFARRKPDLLVLMGDRFEMFAAAVAALPFKIPIAHIHGGELTEGAIDDALRHSISKLSHLHFVSTESYRRRVIQLGEAPDRVFEIGAPALDNLKTADLPGRLELEQQFDIDLSTQPLLVTMHPTTLSSEDAETEIQSLLSVLSALEISTIFTAPNADAGGRRIRAEIDRFVAENQSARMVQNFGEAGYYGLLRHVGAMVGNSSSGIVEGASFNLPVVNIGSRQAGRVAGKNVIHTTTTPVDIASAIRRAFSVEFRESLVDIVNPYGDGNASDRMLTTLRASDISPNLCVKRFFDLE